MGVSAVPADPGSISDKKNQLRLGRKKSSSPTTWPHHLAPDKKMRHVCVVLSIFCALIDVFGAYQFNSPVHRVPTALYETINQPNFDSSGLYRRNTAVTEVMIESPSINSRKITASIVIDTPLADVWNVLTDYNNLAKYVPNLVQSYKIPSTDSTATTRLFQEGAQRIIGFDFKASLTMDMYEESEEENKALKERKLHFKLYDSSMFAAFDGIWFLRYHSRSRGPNFDGYSYKTLLTYSVFVRPKGVVPVIALEWRIREDIPVNLKGVKAAAESLRQSKFPPTPLISKYNTRTEWDTDETLKYIIQNKK